jgi:predicted phage-related endonuclease
VKDASSHITYYPDLMQDSEEWLAARCGMLTASEMGLILTPTLKIAKNDKTRAHLYELLAQRITRYVEPRYVSDDMLRGQNDEVYARQAYMTHFSDVQDMGFVTNSRWGFTIGYSPDGLVGDTGLIECKSRRAKYQVQTILEHVWFDDGETIPADYVLQCQTGMLVTEREWIDLISYCGGLPMAVMRVYPDEAIQTAIVEAAGAFEAEIAEKEVAYRAALAAKASRLIPTERRITQEIF